MTVPSVPAESGTVRRSPSDAARARLASRLAAGAEFLASDPTDDSGALSDDTSATDGPRRFAAAAPPPDPAAPAPVSFAQRRLWFLHQFQPDSPAYHVPAVLRLTGPLSVDALRDALDRLVALHPALRTVFDDADGEPVQRVVDAPAARLDVTDLTDLPAEQREARVRDAVAAERQPPFDLRRGPLLRTRLFRLGEHDHRLFLDLHHIVVDGWSLSVLVNDLVRCYAAATGHGTAPARPPVDPAGHARWQHHRVRAGELDDQLAWWERRLAGASATELAPDRVRPAVLGWRGGRRTVRLDAGLTDQVRATARRYAASPFMVLLAGFVALLHRQTGQSDVVLGTPVAGRDRVELEPLVSLLVNTVVLRTDVSGDPTFADLVARVRDVVLDAQTHHEAPFELLVERLRPVRDPARHPLFQIVFAMKNLPPFERLHVGALTVELLDMVGEVSKFDLSVMAFEGDTHIDCEFEFSTELFDDERIAQLMTQYRAVLGSLCGHPDRRLSAAALLDPDEEDRIVRRWSGRVRDHPTVPVHHLVARRARSAPDSPAVRADGRTLTYGELDRRADVLAARLRAVGAGPGRPVAVCLERGPELVTAFLAVLKAGAAYVPLDPGYPPDRLTFTLADSAACAVLTGEELTGRFAAARTAVLDVAVAIADAEEADAVAPAAEPDPREIAYVIYTSGSSGRPKGVEVTHGGLANLVHWHLDAYQVGPRDRATLVASPGFDACTWELWAALAGGAALHVPPEPVRVAPDRLARWLVDEAITVTFLPTTVAEAVLAEPAVTGSALRLLLTGGDALTRTPPPGLGARLVNHYGPTENTVVATADPVPAQAGPVVHAPPIGRAIANVTTYVLDGAGRPVPVGVPGELCLGGLQVARGYLRDPRRTAERFVPDPFGETPGARLYRTGDLVRWLPDGRLDFLGRLDSQLKVRGFRVEPSEIEAVLVTHPAVREAAVVVRGDGADRRDLAALLVLADGPAPTYEEVRAVARRHLPGYMVPAVLAVVDDLPVTTNGKLDRDRLSWRDGRPLRQESTAEPPVGATERAVAEVWALVLDVPPLGRTDNFFDLGGHSFLALRARQQLAERLGVELNVVDLFQFPTVASLAAHLDRIRATPEPAGKPEPGAPDGYAQRRRAALRGGLARRRQAHEQRRLAEGTDR
ncbi:amino acid adenylation domain-containing protein [Micromonospora citrea]|uniref:Amino acid adenylation domain-containing protein n=1 Tax=Micromonospora citrea TaxID=47855 RepID=A0A1C6UF12_9ACTN|nr:amino acid adenylation domain-containing protein [Micromonospora citrea]